MGGTSLYSERNRLSREEALRLWTQAGGWFSGAEGQKGTIWPRQFADLAVLSDDYFTLDESRIRDIESVLTVVDGKVGRHAGDVLGKGLARFPVADL